jgi:hypothetical protein
MENLSRFAGAEANALSKNDVIKVRWHEVLFSQIKVSPNI